MCYAFTPDSVFKSVLHNSSEKTWQTSVTLRHCSHIYVNKTICTVTCLYTDSSQYGFKSIVLWARMTCLVPRLSQNTSYGWGAGSHSLSFKTFVSFINRLLTGEGNGNPLQYSCLENPMDGGAWWATVGTGFPKLEKSPPWRPPQAPCISWTCQVWTPKP